MSIRTVLSEVGVPVRRPDYKGNAAQYITYQMLGQTGAIWAESTEAETGTEFMINIWSKTDWNYSVDERVFQISRSGQEAVDVRFIMCVCGCFAA